MRTNLAERLGYESEETTDDLMKPAGVASKTTLRKYLKEPLGFQMKCVMALCKRIGISREEFFAAWDY